MSINDFAESKVTIKKSDLLSAMRANLEKHVSDYREAMAGYRAEILAGALALVEVARDASQTIKLDLVTRHAEPQHHTRDYVRVIRMLEMSTAEEITISEHQFAQYVLDEWTWAATFNATKARYSRG